ncbi:MAG: DUF992 domain-containing protein [Pseudomonadota bacterium]
MKTHTLARTGIAAAAAVFLQASSVLAADTPPPPVPENTEKRHLTKVGLLTCDSYRDFGYVIGSSSDLACTFENRRGGNEYYTGAITKVGPDIGFKNQERLVWAVYAPSYQVPRGRLDGTYVGVSAAAGLGLGFGANVLVGNLKNNLNLVPLSLTANVGLNASAGVGALTLTSDTASR